MSKWLKSLLVLTLLIIPMEDGIFIEVNASENPTKIERENIDINSHYGIPNIDDDQIVASGVVSDHQDSAKYTYYTSNVLRINDGYYNGYSGTDDFKKYMNQAEHLIIGDTQTVSLSKNFNNIYGDYQLLKTLQFDKVDLSNTTHLGYMFGSDSGSQSNLEMIDFGTHFNPENVTNFSGMFKDLKELKYLNLGTNFKTTSGRQMDYMFSSLTKLVDLDLGKFFNTSNVSSMNHMFSNLTSLESLSLGDSFITKGVTKMNDMFSNLSKLDHLDLGNNFDTSSVTEMISMFSNTSKITTLGLGDKFNTSKVRNMDFMFSFMTSLEVLDLGENFFTSSVTSSRAMFSNNINLRALDLGDHFDTSSVTTMEQMFSNLTSLEVLELGTQFNTSNVLTMENMFESNVRLKKLNLGDEFNTKSVINMRNMFSRLKSITTLDLGDKFNTSNTRDMFGMFSGMENLEALDLGNLFNTSRVTSMAQMFYNANKLKILDLSSFTIRSSTSISNMLDKTNLSEINLGPYIATLANSGLPSIPSDEYYTGGWQHKDKDFIHFSSSVDFTTNYNGSKIEEPGVYVRKEKTYEITYISPDSSINYPLNGKGYKPGETHIVDFDYTPTIPGKVFKGWIDRDSNILYTKENDVLIIGTKNITLHADFEDIKHTVRFWDEQQNIKDMIVSSKELIDVTELPTGLNKPGYHLIGWSTQPDGSGPLFDFFSTVVEQDMDFYAVYSINVYSVNFYVDNQLLSSLNQEYKTMVSNHDIPQAPLVKGHSFVGWFTEANGLGDKIDFNIKEITDDLVVHAFYQPNLYSVTYLDDLGNVLHEFDVDYNASFKLMELPTKDGFKSEWTINDNVYDEMTMVMSDQDITFKLKYTKNVDVPGIGEKPKPIEPGDKPGIGEKPKPIEPGDKPGIDETPDGIKPGEKPDIDESPDGSKPDKPEIDGGTEDKTSETPDNENESNNNNNSGSEKPLPPAGISSKNILLPVSFIVGGIVLIFNRKRTVSRSRVD